MRVLSIVHAGGGGTILTNEDLMRALTPACTCFILACGPDKWVFSDVADTIERLEEIKFAETWKGGAPLADDRVAASADLLARHKFDVVHVRSLLGSGPELLTALKAAGVPVVLSFHDFTAICPTINLLDADLTFCGGVCTAGEADCAAPQKWFSDIARLKGAYVHTWRARMAAGFEAVDAFVTTSASAAGLLTRHFPRLSGRIEIIEHGRDVEPVEAAAPPPEEGPMRVVVLGVIGAAKGRALVEHLVRRNAAEGAPLEFHLLGGLTPPLAELPGVIAHGPYAREDLPVRLEDIAPSVSLIPSIWPETYSHTLTESWAAGIPVLAGDMGALAERIRRHGGGWLADPRDHNLWWSHLIALKDDPRSWAWGARQVARLREHGTARMARRYRRLYATAQAKLRLGRPQQTI